MTEYEVYFCLSLIPKSQFHGINLESIRKNICIGGATRYLTGLVWSSGGASVLSKVPEESEESDSE